MHVLFFIFQRHLFKIHLFCVLKVEQGDIGFILLSLLSLFDGIIQHCNGVHILLVHRDLFVFGLFVYGVQSKSLHEFSVGGGGGGGGDCCEPIVNPSKIFFL